MRRLAPFAPFEKYEGLGNDFIVVDVANESDVTTDQARALCDRHRGVGADGVLVLLPAAADQADARMRVINADGSIPEMCGNGLRCAVLHLALRRGLDRGELSILSDAGVRRCAFERNGDGAVVVADMGIVRVLGDVAVEVGGARLTLTRVDAGNPHAVTLHRVSREDFERLGPLVAVAPVFERGTNVEFARVDGGALEVLVWERGAGATLACGTGACAAVAAAVAKGIVALDGPVVVRLPGGELEVRYDRVSGRASLRGPARRVYAGKLAGGEA
jgi:diaminopimelate epimerase